MLHAKSLEFKHPITGKQMHLEAPLPEYFTEILNRLKQADNPHGQQSQDNRQRAADFGNRADDEADKGTDAHFTRLPHIFAGQKFADARTQ